MADVMGNVPMMHCFVRGEYLRDMGCGLIGAFPNNRVLMPDPAFWPMMDIAAHRPDFASLSGEYRAEGNQHLFRVETAPQPRVADDLPTTH